MGAPRVRCPTCQRELEWSEASLWRPFCSERCKMVDLGAWFSEARSIAGEVQDPTAGDTGGDDAPLPPGRA
jgi:endogenous inhibitor of DNA gyrase (YacG/DUF329 family)